jgi:hypothetical protein
MTLDQPTAYDQAIYGEPFAVVMRQRLLNMDDPIWKVGAWDIVLPQPTPRRAPEVQRMLAELKAWTTWSSRQLAAVLRTSHTTVRGIENGRPLVAGHSGDLRRRVVAVHGVVGRVARLAGNSPKVTTDALTFTADGGRSATDALQADGPAAALLLALDRLRPRPAGLLVGENPRRDGATAALHE